MKKLTLSFVIIFTFILNSKAQLLIGQFYSSSPNHKITETKIDGQGIAGTPYLNDDWLSGAVILEDGRKYDAYKFKYNIYSQVLSFLNGNDSLEVDENIKEFLLIDAEQSITLKFVNAKNYGWREKRPMFLELVNETDVCTFLIQYKKVIESSDQSLVKFRESKFLKTINEYYIYNKKAAKLTTFDKADSNLKKLFSVNKN